MNTVWLNNGRDAVKLGLWSHSESPRSSHIFTVGLRFGSKSIHRCCEHAFPTGKCLSSARRAAGEKCNRRNRCPPNGPEVNPRGQGPRGYGSAARRMPACEERDAGGVTPCSF